MESLIAPLKLFFRMLTSKSSDNNREIKGGSIRGDSNQVTYDQSSQTSITVNHRPETVVGQKRVDATDAVWRAVLEIKRIPNSIDTIIDLAYPHVPTQQLLRNPHYAAAKRALSFEKHTAAYVNAKRVAEPHKPYATDRLWALFEAYFLLFARPSIILVQAGEDKARAWWDDKLISKALAGQFIPAELKPFTPASEAPLSHTRRIIEQAIEQEIQRTIKEQS